MLNKLLLSILLLSITSTNLLNCIMFFNEDNKFKLNNNFDISAQKAFGNEHCLEYFNTQVLKNPNLRQKLLKEENAQEIEFQTSDNIKINGYFIDRGANKALLVGQGFLASCEKLIPFFKLFPEYDLLIINYRWYPFKFSNYLSVDPLSKLIYEAKEDVIGAVHFLKDYKNYETITGIGLCYSALIYVIAQAEAIKIGEKLFDKLILDSSYLSTAETADAVIKDPKLCCDNKHGGTPKIIKSILSYWIISESIKYFGTLFLGEKFKSLSIEQYLPLISKTPILFIHGKKDLLVPFKTFENIYKAANNAPRCAFITKNEHTINHIKSKEAYSYLAKMFIEIPIFEDFIDLMIENFTE